MNPRNQDSAELKRPHPEESAPSDTGRKPYQKPDVLYRAPLEAMAAACTPVSASAGKVTVGPCTTTFS